MHCLLIPKHNGKQYYRSLYMYTVKMTCFLEWMIIFSHL